MTTLELLYFYPLVTLSNLLNSCYWKMLACQSCNEWRQKGNQIKDSHNGYAVGGPVNIPKTSDRGSDFYLTFILKILMVKVVNWHMCSSQKR
jgi:hypothetical protein